MTVGSARLFGITSPWPTDWARTPWTTKSSIIPWSPTALERIRLTNLSALFLRVTIHPRRPSLSWRRPTAKAVFLRDFRTFLSISRIVTKFPALLPDTAQFNHHLLSGLLVNSWRPTLSFIKSMFLGKFKTFLIVGRIITKTDTLIRSRTTKLSFSV